MDQSLEALEPAFDEQPAPDATPPSPAVMDVPRHGLGPGGGDPKKVVIIGAGMAGLVAASELARAGHQPIILEAQNRVGWAGPHPARLRAGPIRRGRARCASPASTT